MKNAPTKWDDVGFKVRGEPNTLWLGSSLVKIHRDFEFEYVDGIDIYDQIIFEQLTNQDIRDSILREVDNA